MKRSLPKAKKHWILGTTTALMSVAAFALWSLRPPVPPALLTSPATIADIEDAVIATGTIDAAKLVSVGAQASGQIKSLKVEPGDQVKAGDVIAEIDATNQENSLRNAEAAIASVRAQRSAQMAALKQARLAFARQKQLVARQLVAKADYDSAEATLSSTQAQIAALDAQIRQSQTLLDTARTNLGYTMIVAPIDGTVVAVVAKEGQTVNALQSAPTIVKLAKLDTVTINAEISEADVIKVRSGQAVYFTILGDPTKRYYARLRTVEPAPSSIETNDTTSDSTSKAIYYNALFDVDNPNGVLRIAMTAQVHVVMAQAKGAVTIPAAALGAKTKDGSYNVQVVDDRGRPIPRTIKVGINNNVTAQVLGGLGAGEKVVVGEAAAVTDATQAQQRRGPPTMMGGPG
ncbi:efflux RND transporter periplasmic adaptor subunit [Lysobacter terrae]